MKFLVITVIALEMFFFFVLCQRGSFVFEKKGFPLYFFINFFFFFSY